MNVTRGARVPAPRSPSSRGRPRSRRSVRDPSVHLPVLGRQGPARALKLNWVPEGREILNSMQLKEIVVPNDVDSDLHRELAKRLGVTF